ncbi:MAG: class I SAM-dependent methyltransferase [Planctomycetota bacterium]
MSEICPACDGREFTVVGQCGPTVELKNADTNSPLRRVAEKVRDSRLLRCERCNLLVRKPELDQSDLHELYENLPDAYWDYDSSKVGSWKVANRFLTEVHQRDHAINVLDVGAFDGSFLKTLPPAWNKSAIEPAEAAAESLRRSNIPCIASFVEELDDGKHNSSFDVITMFDVFEHLPKPVETICRLAELLKPGGRLVLSTGNSEHWSWRLLGASHWYMHSAQHLCVGNPQFFQYASEKSGLGIERIQAHSHQESGSVKRWNQSLETIHAWARRSERTVLMRLIQALPGTSHLVHKTSSPFANALRDHFLVVMTRSANVSQ